MSGASSFRTLTWKVDAAAGPSRAQNLDGPHAKHAAGIPVPAFEIWEPEVRSLPL
jgi:hypothetical protein